MQVTPETSKNVQLRLRGTLWRGLPNGPIVNLKPGPLSIFHCARKTTQSTRIKSNRNGISIQICRMHLQTRSQLRNPRLQSQQVLMHSMPVITLRLELSLGTQKVTEKHQHTTFGVCNPLRRGFRRVWSLPPAVLQPQTKERINTSTHHPTSKFSFCEAYYTSIYIYTYTYIYINMYEVCQRKRLFHPGLSACTHPSCPLFACAWRVTSSLMPDTQKTAFDLKVGQGFACTCTHIYVYNIHKTYIYIYVCVCVHMRFMYMCIYVHTRTCIHVNGKHMRVFQHQADVFRCPG